MAMVRSVMLLKTTTNLQLTFILLLCLMCHKYEAAEDCDFIKCVINTKSFISDLIKGGTLHCGKFLDIFECSNYCMHEYYPRILSHSDKNLLSFEQYCVQSIANRLNVKWSCIARHTFQLLTCLANISSMTSNSVHQDALGKESCRKSLEFLDCPTKVLLLDCGKESVEVVKDILQSAVDYFMPSSCKDTSMKKVLSLPVLYHAGYEFMELAKCFDRKLNVINDCFLQIIQNEVDLHEFVCGEDALSRCVHFEVSKDCREVPSVRKLLLKLFSLGGIRCDHPQFAFTHLTSYKPVDFVTTESSVQDKFSQQSDLTFNDEIHHQPQTSAPQVVGSEDELFHRENSSHIDTNYFKAVNGANFCCDKTMHTVIALIIFLILNCIDRMHL